jgi:hypothetical protein
MSGKGLYLLVALFPMAYSLYRYINIDLWYDEILTLLFVFTPIERTVSLYPMPNNHIFFNVLNNLYVSIMGIESVFNLLENPFILRSFYLLYAALTFIFIYKLAKLLTNSFYGILALVILLTSVPYHNFLFQIRGYSLSIMLFSMLLFFIFSNRKSSKTTNSALIVLITALFIYTVPSNLYYVASILCIFGILFLRDFIRVFGGSLQEGSLETTAKISFTARLFSDPLKSSLVTILLVCSGVLLAVVLYIPVIGSLLKSSFVQSMGLFHLPTLYETMPRVLAHTTSSRYLLLLIIPMALLASLYGFKKKSLSTVQGHILFFAGLFIAPFLVSFVRGDRPFDRLFSISIPIFSILTALCLYELGKGLPNFKFKQPVIFSVLAAYCFASFGMCIYQVNKRQISDFRENKTSQSLLHNYFLTNYDPKNVVDLYRKEYAKENRPLLNFDSDGLPMPLYLKFRRLKYFAEDTLQEALKLNMDIFIIAMPPRLPIGDLPKELSDRKITRLNDTPGYYNLYRVSMEK